MGHLTTTYISPAFWAALGFMTGIAAAFFIVQLWRPQAAITSSSDVVDTTAIQPKRKLLIAGVTATFAAICFVVYALVGRSELANNSTVTMGVNAAAPPHALNTDATPGSMADVTGQLAAKVSAGNGSDADWQLLQQSYEFLGDDNAAALAKEHKLSPTVTANVGTVSPNKTATTLLADTQLALTPYQQATAKNPDDAAAWLAIAQLQRTARHFPEASAAFTEVIKLKKMDAGAWADYADVVASLHGSLRDKEVRDAIDHSLKLDAKHSKALWLKASLALEDKHYADALQTWQQLRAVLPDNSPDIAIIDANIAEAKQLSGGKQAVVTAQPVATVAQIRGSVTLDPSIQKLATASMTLFIYAKAEDSPAPVAAWRGNVTSWPNNFVLDDSNAMMPMRKLSQYQRVKLEARLSNSGQALAQSGDLQADPITVDTHSDKPVALKISRRVQ